MIRSMVLSAVLGMIVLPASANCKGLPDAYEIVDLGDMVGDQAEAKAIAINDKGRIVISAYGSGFDAKPVEYLGTKPGSFSALKDGAIEVEATTQDLLTRDVRLVSYEVEVPEFSDMLLTTLVDKKGGEIAVNAWCAAPEEDQKMTSFAISPSGKHAAATFVNQGRHSLAKCVESGPAQKLKDVPASLSIDRISDDGVMVGTDGNEFWRAFKKDYEPLVTPEGWSQLKVTDVTESGQLVGSAFGVVTSPSIIVEPDGELQKIDILPGKGWDTLWQVLSPCGVMIGEATQTNFEAFLDLPEAEQVELRSDLRAYLRYARDARTTYFVWSADDENEAGKELREYVPNLLEDWAHITLVAANRKGQFVGHGTRHNGDVRAILIKSKR